MGLLPRQRFEQDPHARPADIRRQLPEAFDEQTVFEARVGSLVELTGAEGGDLDDSHGAELPGQLQALPVQRDCRGANSRVRVQELDRSDDRAHGDARTAELLAYLVGSLVQVLRAELYALVSQPRQQLRASPQIALREWAADREPDTLAPRRSPRGAGETGQRAHRQRMTQKSPP